MHAHNQRGLMSSLVVTTGGAGFIGSQVMLPEGLAGLAEWLADRAANDAEAANAKLAARGLAI